MMDLPGDRDISSRTIDVHPYFRHRFILRATVVVSGDTSSCFVAGSENKHPAQPLSSLARSYSIRRLDGG
jgi:hypothetical protein